MEYRELGRTGISVSSLCLGTMTFGEQNTEAEAHEQLDYALGQGINFIDTAEMYPVPPQGTTQGRTESQIGTWLAKRGQRDRVILATKAAGPADWLEYLRGGPEFSRQQLTQALEASLARLQTDYVDLYQLHWPARATNFFGQLGYQPQAEFVDATEGLQEVLAILAEFVKAGKVRAIGLSNETPWGVMKCVQLADQLGVPRVASVQNPYNLLNRSFEVGLAEVAHREQVGLLAYSPLAFGVLTGKYLNNQWPAKGRLTLYKRFQRYTTELAEQATERYVALAEQYGMSAASLALAFVTSRPFVTSNIIGATSMAQLQENIASSQLTLSDEALADIEAVQQQIQNPCP